MERGFNQYKPYTSTQEWSKSHSEQFDARISISRGFLGIEVGADTRWSVIDTTTHGRSWCDTVEFTWEVSGTLQPGEGVKDTTYAVQGDCALTYSYKLTESIWMDGAKMSFPWHTLFGYEIFTILMYLPL